MKIEDIQLEKTAVNAPKSEEKLEGEGAVEEGSEGDVDSEKGADEPEPESKEEVMDSDGTIGLSSLPGTCTC